MAGPPLGLNIGGDRKGAVNEYQELNFEDSDPIADAQQDLQDGLMGIRRSMAPKKLGGLTQMSMVEPKRANPLGLGGMKFRDLN